MILFLKVGVCSYSLREYEDMAESSKSIISELCFLKCLQFNAFWPNFSTFMRYVRRSMRLVGCLALFGLALGCVSSMAPKKTALKATQGSFLVDGATVSFAQNSSGMVFYHDRTLDEKWTRKPLRCTKRHPDVQSLVTADVRSRKAPTAPPPLEETAPAALDAAASGSKQMSANKQSG